jgi:outer membrane receptor protein involved in Fe transport
MRKKLIISAIGAQLIMMQGLQAETLALEEVIVTAEKREQSLQDVPASISAFSASQIEQAGWDDISQLETSIPSVSMGGVVNLTASMNLNDSTSLRLYCDNCSDELIRTQVTTFATTQGGGGRSIYGPGRRVGAEISYNF